MENPNGIEPSNVVTSPAVVGLDAANHGGRPPDNSMCVDTPTPIECPRSPISAEGSNNNKKDSVSVRLVSDIAMGDGGLTQFRALGGEDSLVHGPRVGEATVGANIRQENLTFRDKLLSNTTKNLTPTSLAELDVVVRSEDVRLGGSNTLPEIQFSDRIHEEIDAKLACSLVIRLLGRSIGYQAMLNRIHVLWKPRGEFSLTDLDNVYYLVRFADEIDFHNNVYPSQIVAWVRLPNLPYRYYTKSLFRHIEAATGKFVRVDYKTAKGKRIGNPRKDVGDVNSVSGKNVVPGSQFATLVDVSNSVVHVEGSDPTSNDRRMASMSLAAEDNLVGVSHSPSSRPRVHGVTNGVGSDGDIVAQHLNGSLLIQDPLVEKTKSGNERSKVSLGTSVRVASQARVVAAKSALNVDKHAAIQVLDLTHNLGPRVGKGRILPYSLRGGISKPVTNEPEVGLSNLMEDLTNAENLERSKVGVSSSDGVGDGDSGALDRGFNRSFKLLVRRRKLEIVIVMEPRISGNAADKFIRRTGFNCSYKVEAHGFAGGIWVLWKESITIDVLAVSNQYVHCFCSSSGEAVNFFVAFVYASPNAVKRRGLWPQLEALRPDNEAAWVIGRDLNVIGSSLERQGGAHNRVQACRYLCDFMLDSGLLDMGFTVYHLVKFGSDHRPILLDTCPHVAATGNRPFRYIAAWNKHPDFASFFKGVWSDSASMDQNVSLFQQRSHMWNSEVFGHVGRRKKQLLDRIKGVELALENSGNSYLLMLEDDLKRELDSMLSQEESLWYQKARTQWIENGDHNTTFFHMATTVRNRHNHIHMLRLDDGSWCDDHAQLKAHAIKFFQKLFTSEQDHQRVWDLTSSFFQFRASDVCSPSVMVADMVSVSDDWDWSRISPLLPPEIRDRIADVQPPQVGLGAEAPEWCWTDTRQFTSSSAYFLLSDMDSGSSDNFLKKVWGLPIPQRVRTFLWITLHNHNLTNVERYRCHLAPPAICDICGYHTEDMDHILRHCVVARGIWTRVIRP
ncbi:hypothetical protein GQ457_04G022170 [Hibiscus cannabinus]